jgi:hypothetical protein
MRARPLAFSEPEPAPGRSRRPAGAGARPESAPMHASWKADCRGAVRLRTAVRVFRLG